MTKRVNNKKGNRAKRKNMRGSIHPTKCRSNSKPLRRRDNDLMYMPDFLPSVDWPRAILPKLF